MLRTMLLGAGVLAALFSVLIFSGKISIGGEDEKAQGTVSIWGTIDDTQMNFVVQQFNPQAENYDVSYREIPEAQFNKVLLEALANGTGPDLILAPHQMILSNADRLSPFPLSSLSEKAFKDLYVDGASVFFTPQGALALPVSVDPLVLFYNRVLFSKRGIVTPPRYWDELVNMVPLLTVRNSQGQFVESAISLGAPNTPYMKEILMSTVQQLGQVPVLKQYLSDGSLLISVTADYPADQEKMVYPLTTAARFFSQFSDPTKNTFTWSQYSGNALDFFLAEKMAMYIGYASELQSLRARNPKADIEMTYLPQTRGEDTFAMTGQMYGIATLKGSKNLLTSFTVQSQFAGSDISPKIAGFLGMVPGFRQYATTQGLSDVIMRSMLVVRPWHDSFPTESTNLTATIFSDILSGRLGPSDAVTAFVSRLQDLYTPF